MNTNLKNKKALKMNYKSTTISQIAKEANVSISTVSRVFNGTAPEKVGKDAKQRVEKAIREHGYKPNAHARGLASGKTGLIGVQILSLNQPLSNVKILNSITEHARQKGYSIILGGSNWDAESEIDSINVMLEKGIDGLIWQPVDNPDVKMVRKIQKRKHPIVWLNKNCNFNIPASCNDEIESGRLAAEYLLSQGCSKPAFAGFLYEPHTSLRLEGWSTLLKGKKLGSACLVHPFSQKDEQDHKSLQNMFYDLFQASQKGEFDGLFISGSQIACIANDVLCSNIEFKNNDIPIIGHNMVPIYPGRYAIPTISPDNKKIGIKSVEMLMNILDGKIVESEIVTPSLMGVRHCP